MGGINNKVGESMKQLIKTKNSGQLVIYTQKNVCEKIFNISKLNVNSFHNCGITEHQLAHSLKPFAVSPDKVVEGLMHEELPILAIQWHPERDNQSRLFNRQIIKKVLNQGKFW